ncbi:MAG TPA: hypothetical protein VK485_01485 [Sphingomicrobium sp.]|nr:hypothetical protein [Sphingomicrobium sp.]
MRARLRSSTSNPTRRDGWTAERQLGFLAALARTCSVSRAAGSVGMSRESAYRLRLRSEGALFAALWDSALASDVGAESHNRVLSDGHLARLLGNHFRRESNDFGSHGPPASPR